MIDVNAESSKGTRTSPDGSGALPELLSKGIGVGTLFINVHPPEVCDVERPWGCDMPHVGRAVRRGRLEVKLETLYAFYGVNTPIGRRDVNDGKGLEADILKVPHHGALGVAPKGFLDRVGARVALVPAPKHLWESDRNKRC